MSQPHGFFRHRWAGPAALAIGIALAGPPIGARGQDDRDLARQVSRLRRQAEDLAGDAARLARSERGYAVTADQLDDLADRLAAIDERAARNRQRPGASLEDLEVLELQAARLNDTLARRPLPADLQPAWQSWYGEFAGLTQQYAPERFVPPPPGRPSGRFDLEPTPGRARPPVVADRPEVIGQLGALANQAHTLATYLVEQAQLNAQLGPLAREADALAVRADRLTSRIDRDRNLRFDRLAADFGDLASRSDRLGTGIAQSGVPLAQRMWGDYYGAMTQLSGSLRECGVVIALRPVYPTVPSYYPIPIPQPQPLPPPLPTYETEVALIDQVLILIERFQATVYANRRAIPESDAFRAEAAQLHGQALAFRQSAVTPGTPPDALLGQLGSVDAAWIALAQRTDRVSGGRPGPNIDRVREIGGVIDQLHSLLQAPALPVILR